jgi:hypothetical protein
MEVTTKWVLDIYPETPHFRLNRWEMLLDDSPPGGPERDFKRPDGRTKCLRAQLNNKLGVFDPANVKRGRVSRTKEWQHTLRIAIESVEKLLELQESFEDSATNLPEAFAGSAKGEYYEQITAVDLGSVHKALAELYDAQAIEEPPN